MFCSFEPVEPPANRIPAPLKLLIVRAFLPLSAENTTLLTFAAIKRPFVPAAVPAPAHSPAPPAPSKRQARRSHKRTKSNSTSDGMRDFIL